MDAYHKRGIEEEKRRNLLVRRQRLSELLEKENKEYEVVITLLCAVYSRTCALDVLVGVVG